MKKTAALFILFLLPVSLFADETELSRFYQEYSEVYHSLMSDQGCLQELKDLYALDATGADKIANFWLFKARRECYDFVEKIKSNIDFKDLYKEIDYYIDQKTVNISGGKYDEIQKKAREEAEQCRYCIYYENWDAINKMIIEKLKAVKEEQKEDKKKEH